jgi:hypothetical protein
MTWICVIGIGRSALARDLMRDVASKLASTSNPIDE